MKRFSLLFILILLTISCKSKLATLSEGEAKSALSASKIIDKHYKNERDFSSVYIKANARYQDDRQTQNVTAEIRIKKDEAILISVRFFGITMAKALITPTEVKYYEKINSEFFEGDYTTLSRWLGTDLDYFKVQNMLTGEALDDLTQDKYSASIDDKLYKLDNNSVATKKTFYFEAENFLVKKQEIIQMQKNRQLQVSYPGHQKHDNIIMPAALLIEAMQEKGKNSINITYTSVNFNEDFSVPYSVPEGYKQIFIN